MESRHNGPESLRHKPCTDGEKTREFTSQEVAQLAVYLAFEDAMREADERLITQEEAIARMRALTTEVERGTEAA